MAKTIELDRGELTEEGKKMWKDIENLEKLISGESLLPVNKPKRIRINQFEIGLTFVRLEIKRMIENSKRVIVDCDKIIKTYKTQREYLASDAKVAKSIHQNLIDRLQRILEYKPAFDHEIKVDEE